MLTKVLARRSITTAIKYSYQAFTFIQDKHTDSVIINPNLFHLHVYHLTHSPFKERFAAVMLLDCYRTFQPEHHFQTIVQHCIKNLGKFQKRSSLSTLLLQMHYYKYSKKDDISKVAKAYLSLPQKQQSTAHFNMKFLIAVQSLLGLDHFTEEELRNINYRQFRPVILSVTIQLFYQSKLQGKMALVDELIDMFVDSQDFIPVSDLHHLSYSVRIIDNIKFKQCYYRIRRKMQENMVQNSKKQKNDHSASVTDKALFQKFRKNINKRYSTHIV